MRNQLKRLRAFFARETSHDPGVHFAQIEIRKLRSQVGELRAAFREFQYASQSDMGNAGAHIDDLRGELRGLQERVGGEMGNAGAHIDDLRGDLHAFKEQIGAELGNAGAHIDDLRGDLFGFKDRIGAELGNAGAHIDDLRGGFYGFRDDANARISDLFGKIERLRQEFQDFKGQATGALEHERNRLDYVLGTIEGLDALRLELVEARKTAAFQAAFEEDEPLVTVCTGTAGRPDLLIERCLASLRAQTYKNLQILVIGDGCVDDTGERIAQLGDPRIEFYNLPERGPYPRPGIERWYVAGMNAANASNHLARGQFITFLDDDDTCDPDRVEVLLEAARKDRAEFVWHQFWFKQPDDTWDLWGNGRLEISQVSNSTVFYHRFFTKLPWDLNAYRMHEPGDWNRIRKIKYLRPRMSFVERPLTWYHRDYQPAEFVAHEGERYLD